MITASEIPRRLARPCWWAGSLLDRIAMNTMLSIPRTISSAASVASDIRLCTLRSGATAPAAPSGADNASSIDGSLNRDSSTGTPSA